MTKLLAISDIHQGTDISPPSGIRVVSQSKLITNLIDRSPDAVIISGDLQDYMWNDGTTPESVNSVKKSILDDQVLETMNKSKIPVYFVFGNTDIMDCEKETETTPLTDEIREWFSTEFTNFFDCHMRKYKIDKYTISGYQDANETDEHSSGKCWDETQIHKEYRPFISNLTKEERKNLILITHTPPRGILDFSSLGSRHIGSFYLRELIDDFQPKLSMFGHVHYLGGYSMFSGRTQCLNVSSFGLAVSYDILFGQSAFEVNLNPEEDDIETTMIVPHFWEGKSKYPFLEYRKCHGCGRFAPFARRQFKYCRICLGTRRIQNQSSDQNG
ncbi:MAG: metallophosphoesterase family protein [Candidatus Kariarchaeaceae archaeon]|jgi:Icc-related predicted phosphoesterase/ribosomal protein S14